MSWRRRVAVTAVALAPALVAGAAIPASGAAGRTAATASGTYRVYGGPVLTADDVIDNHGHVYAGYLVARQTLRSATAHTNARPYRDEATRLDRSTGKSVWSDGGDLTGGYAVNPPSLHTSFAMGQEQNDYGTLAVTDNVSQSASGFSVHASGPVWVEALCATGTRYCWKNLGGKALSGPSIVNADGTIWVFARFADGVRAAVLPRGSATWSAWQLLPGSLVTLDAPAATLVAPVNGKDVVEVVVTGSNKHLYRRVITGIGDDPTEPGTIEPHWHRVPGAVTTTVAPAIAYSEPMGTVTMSLVTGGGRVWVTPDSGATWQKLSGVTAGQFAPGAMGDNLTKYVDIAVRGTDYRTYVVTSHNGGSTWGSWVKVLCVRGVKTYC